MKKYFMFATVAIAALFASCSNSDDFVAPQVTSEDVDSGDALVPIQIGVTQNYDLSTTRGTGTVGSVGGTDDASRWDNQLINVFMFNKGTLDLATEKDATTGADVPLFDNQLMITPGSKNAIPGSTASAHSGQAMIWDTDDASKQGVIKYYPIMGNFDFFGYHGDDAITTKPALNTAGNAFEVPFAIDGSQDLMSTKAVQSTSTWPNANDDVTRFFSAYSGRRGIHPNLAFDHLLTRLQFNIKAGNDEAAGVEAGVQPDPYASATTYSGVYVTKIEIFSRITGSLITAWTPEAGILDNPNGDANLAEQIRGQKIKWDALVYDTNDPSANTCGWVELKQRPAPGTDPSVALVALSPVAPDYAAGETDKFPLKTVGEALIVSKPVTIIPNNEMSEATSVTEDGNTYYIRITLEQTVPDNHKGTSTAKKTFMRISSFTPPEGETAFKLGYSYNVNLVLYGAEEIKVFTSVARWEEVDNPVKVEVE